MPLSIQARASRASRSSVGSGVPGTGVFRRKPGLSARERRSKILGTLAHPVSFGDGTPKRPHMPTAWLMGQSRLRPLNWARPRHSLGWGRTAGLTLYRTRYIWGQDGFQSRQGEGPEEDPGGLLHDREEQRACARLAEV